MDPRQQVTAFFTLLVVLITTLVVVQLWILSAALDAWLLGELDVLVPAAVASGALCLANAGLLAYVLRLDAGPRRRPPVAPPRPE